MYVLIVTKLFSVVRQLAERHARLNGDVARLDQLIADASASKQKLQAQADATGLLLASLDKRVDPARIAAVEAYKGRYGGPRGPQDCPPGTGPACLS